MGARQHRRPRPQDRRYPDLGEEQAHRAACQRQHKALREELSNQAAAAGSQRTSHRELTLARAGTGKQQVRSVHAPYDEHEPHQRQQYQQGGARVPCILIPQAHCGKALRLKAQRRVSARGHQGQFRLKPGSKVQALKPGEVPAAPSAAELQKSKQNGQKGGGRRDGG